MDRDVSGVGDHRIIARVEAGVGGALGQEMTVAVSWNPYKVGNCRHDALCSLVYTNS